MSYDDMYGTERPPLPPLAHRQVSHIGYSLWKMDPTYRGAPIEWYATREKSESELSRYESDGGFLCDQVGEWEVRPIVVLSPPNSKVRQ